MVAAAENMQAFGRDPFSGNRDSVFLGSGSIAGDELIFLLSWYYLVS